MYTIKEYITVDKDIQNGQPVFAGTRVPVESLLWHLEKGISVDDFLEDFPSVSKEQVEGVLSIFHKLFNSENINKLYEIAA